MQNQNADAENLLICKFYMINITQNALFNVTLNAETILLILCNKKN